MSEGPPHVFDEFEPEPEDIVRRRERDVVLQRVIDALSERLAGHPEDEVIQVLDAELAERGFPEMPARWREAVTSSIASGHPYVVSMEGAEDRIRRHEEPPGPVPRAT